MTNYLQQDGGHSKELEAIQTCSNSIIGSLVDELREADDILPFADDLHARIAKVEGVDWSTAAALLRHVFWIGSISNREGKDPSTVVNELCEELTAKGWNSSDLKNWGDGAHLLNELVNMQEFSAARKAIELSYDYADILTRAKILTDIRPVFNDEGNAIISTVVSYCLRLNYQTGNQVKELAIVMDDNEICALKEQCERALEKSTKASELMNSIGNIPSSVSGKQRS